MYQRKYRFDDQIFDTSKFFVFFLKIFISPNIQIKQFTFFNNSSKKINQ